MIDVVHLITSLETGGAQRMLAKLLAELDPAQFRSSVITMVNGGPMEDRLREQGVSVEGLGMRAGRPRWGARRDLVRRLRELRPHVLQSWLWHADLLGALAYRSAGVPALAWNLRNTPVEYGDGRSAGLAARWTPKACAWLSKRPDVVVSNSRAGIRSMSAMGWKPRAWRYIPNGFDLERFRPYPGARELVEELLPGPASDVRAVVLARFHPMKNHAALIAAVQQLNDPRLRVACLGNGTDGPEFQQLLSRGSDGRVVGLGERGDAHRLLSGFDFLVLPSLPGEAFPNVLGEALACGIPCVTTPSGDAAHIVGDSGIVAASARADDLQEALGAILALDSDQRSEWGARGRARMQADYSLESVAARYAELYTELAAR